MVRGALLLCTVGRICNRCTGFVVMTTYTLSHICKLIALYTANPYSAEREMSASACTRSMAGCVIQAVSETFWNNRMIERTRWITQSRVISDS